MENNICYSPEAFGLTELAEVDIGEEYTFDTVIAWQHTDGSIYWAHSSGCSCPAPFEEYGSVDALNKIATQADLDIFYNFMQAHYPYDWRAPALPGAWYANSLAMYNTIETAYRATNKGA